MCRIILALGKFELAPLIASLQLMAQDQNSLHELNQRKGWGTFQHPDGWGLAYLKDQQWQINKSTQPIFQDETINQFKNLQTNFALLHTRKATVGEITLKNTHPFQKEDFIFCHNGHSRDQFEIHKNFPLQGDTDSERIFCDILSQLKEKAIPHAIRTTFHRYPYCKGAVIILSNPETTWIAIRENVFPKYYCLYLAKTEDSLILSSEIPKNLPKLNWQSLEQNTILEINNRTLTIINHKPAQTYKV